MIRRRVLLRLIWVYTICKYPFYGTLGINGLRGIDTGEATLSYLIAPPSETLSTLLGKNLLQEVAKSFFIKQTPF